MRQPGEQSVWDEDQARAYAAKRHGTDGKRFLDPHIYQYMSRDHMQDQDVADIGCGTGPWSLYAHEQGARSVNAFDVNPAMVEQAKALFEQSGSIPPSVRLDVHDANALPPEWDRRFSRLLSINVGCNLADLRRHFAEAYRVATAGATMLVTAPHSLGTVFDDGYPDGIAELVTAWENLSAEERTSVTAKRMISRLSHVLRATFRVLASGEMRLETEELSDGTPMLRRIPGLTVDNNAHTAQSYIESATQAGWTIENIAESKFGSEAERTAFNATSANALGKAYVTHPPFLVMNLRKNG